MSNLISKIFYPLCFSILATAAMPAVAIPVTFTAINFQPILGSGPAPDPVVTGSFDYSLGSSIPLKFSLNSFEMQISDKVFSLADVSAGSFYYNFYISGYEPGVVGFFLEFSPSAARIEQLEYSMDASPGNPFFGAWRTEDIIIGAVPEPAAVLILLLSLAGLFLSRPHSDRRISRLAHSTIAG